MDTVQQSQDGGAPFGGSGYTVRSGPREGPENLSDTEEEPHAADASSRSPRPRARRVRDRGRARSGCAGRAGVDDDGGPAEPADAADRGVHGGARAGRADD